MKYNNICEAIFINRPNRFIAEVEIEGKEEIVHVKNTGRCKELLIPGTVVYLNKSENPNRKTKYDLIAVKKDRKGKTPLLINMDSQIPNDAVAEWIPRSGILSSDAHITREVTFQSSRFDFYIEDGNRKIFLEVKGVTLERHGVAMFPDAPTERGIKHINELCDAVKKGYEGFIIFVIQMKEIELFRPNYDTHREFGEALKKAAAQGVKIMAVDSIVKEDSIFIDKSVKIRL